MGGLKQFDMTSYFFVRRLQQLVSYPFSSITLYHCAFSDEVVRFCKVFNALDLRDSLHLGPKGRNISDMRVHSESADKVIWQTEQESHSFWFSSSAEVPSSSSASGQISSALPEVTPGVQHTNNSAAEFPERRTQVFQTY